MTSYLLRRGSNPPTPFRGLRHWLCLIKI